MDEGVIKYNCNWIPGDSLSREEIQGLMKWRDRIYSLGLIGVYPNGIGFGNISMRIADSQFFVISGTQTGHLPQLQPEHYTLVTDFNLEENCLTCQGKIKASSESLTHAAIYSYYPNIHGIIHVHHPQIWRMLLHQVPTTRQDVPYGTPEMAKEMFRLFQEEDLISKKILVMAGHEDGFLTIGQNLDEAGEVLMCYVQCSVGSGRSFLY